jgi:glycosyltransferase involved in cell wall biosynthesis
MPSIQEAYGLTGQEAMACGVPLVGFRTGMCGDALEHGRNGLVVDVGDVAGLREAIGHLLKRPDERARMGAAARDYVCEHLSYDCNARRYAELYSELLARPQRRTVPISR